MLKVISIMKYWILIQDYIFLLNIFITFIYLLEGCDKCATAYVCRSEDNLLGWFTPSTMRGLRLEFGFWFLLPSAFIHWSSPGPNSYVKIKNISNSIVYTFDFICVYQRSVLK